jgi:signal transduction histidine kinase
MPTDRMRLVDRLAGRWRDSKTGPERVRAALAEIEEQRDDAVVYLSTIKLVLEVIGRCQGEAQCAQQVAELLVGQLMVETCAIVVHDGPQGAATLAGFATQAQRLGGPSQGLGETGWLALVRLLGTHTEPVCFARTPDGGFTGVSASELVGEGFCVLPFAVAGEAGGALVLHSLVTPALTFARSRALGLLAEIVGQALTVSHTRERTQRLCSDLEAELGVTRRVLSAQQESLRSHEENIQQLTQTLIRSNRVKREFLSTVSHELRTPINAILGYSSLIRDGMVGPVTDDQANVLDRVLSNTRNLNALIDDILFFTQLESDRMLVRSQQVAIATLIDEALEALPGRPPADQVRLVIEIEPAAATWRVDGAIARRILFHLLSNAFKFTTTGCVRVRAEPGEERGRATISVSDTGVGMPPERIDELFEIFAQADSSTTRRYNGLGMGLTLVQRCARLLGGEVMVESQLEKGSTFRITLPDVLAEPAPADAPGAGPTLQ